MLTPCPECAHGLWSGFRSVGGFPFVLYVGDEKSDSYAERVRRCPECGTPLGADALEPSGAPGRG